MFVTIYVNNFFLHLILMLIKPVGTKSDWV